MRNESIRVSVVLPWAGDPSLRFVLEALAPQILDHGAAEILLATADPASAEPSLRPYRATKLRVVEVDVPTDAGHSAPRLRNRGVEEAQGHRVVLLDSDVVPGPEFLHRHAHAEGVLCGLIRELPADAQVLLRTAGDRGFDRLWKAAVHDWREIHHSDNASAFRGTWKDCFSGSLSLPKELFLAVGGFDTDGFRCHDLEFGCRLQRSRAPMTIDPQCRAIHLEHRRSLLHRIGQLQGWLRISQRYEEAAGDSQTFVESFWERFARVQRDAERRFRELTAGKKGIRAGATFVLPPEPESVFPDWVTSMPHVREEHPTCDRVYLRLTRDCWDYSVLRPKFPLASLPTMTVVIPAFRSAQHLGRAIESVLCQTRQDFEVLVIDDGSEDDTARIAGTYARDGRVRWISSIANLGLSRTLNRALGFCRGRFLLQLDADDWLGERVLERVLEGFGSESVVAVYGSPFVHHEGNVTREEGEQCYGPEEHFVYAGIQAPRAFRVAVLIAARGWPVDDPYRGRYYEDRRILARLADLGDVKYLDGLDYHVQVNSGSLGRANPDQAAAAKLIILGQEAARRERSLSWTFAGPFLRARFDPLVAEHAGSWSVVIPHRNQWPYLKYTLHALAESDLPDDAEIVVIDDGSIEAAPFDVRDVDSRARLLALVETRGAAAARNRGVAASTGERILFCDADHIVPPNIFAALDRAHLDEYRTVVASTFGRRTFSVLPAELPVHRRRELLESCRFTPHHRTLGEALLAGRELCPFAAEGGDVWKRALEFSVTDTWQTGWADLLLEYGPALADYSARWMRVGTGCLSMPRVLFEDLGGFDESLRSMEDYEFGIRLQEAGADLWVLVDAEPFHQVHPVDVRRPADDKAAVARLEARWPGYIERLEKLPPRRRPPGAAPLLALRGGPDVSRKTPSRADKTDAGDPAAVFVLTFDDGPHANGTPATAAALDEFKAPATFFFLASKLRSQEDLCRHLIASGHQIGLHGWDHRRLDSMSSAETAAVLRRSVDRLEEVVGTRPVWFRPTYGILTEAARFACDDLGLKIAGWDIAVPDWSTLVADEMITELAQHPLRPAGRGPVYLFHDGTGDPLEMAKAIRWLLGVARRSGARAVSLDEYHRGNPVPDVEMVVTDVVSSWLAPGMDLGDHLRAGTL